MPSDTGEAFEEDLEVESSIAPPALSCPKCDGLLPLGLGVIRCELCHARVRVDHPGVRRQWREEKVACPSCSQLLIAGVEHRPATLECGSCHTRFDLVPKVVKVEVECPNCAQRLRLRQRPGAREITCPACETPFRIGF